MKYKERYKEINKINIINNFTRKYTSSQQCNSFESINKLFSSSKKNNNLGVTC